MTEKKKYKIGFRLYAEVELTEDELKAVAKGDSSCIEKKYNAGEVKLGGGDSYIPIPWIQDNDALPDELIAEVSKLADYDDITVEI